MQQRSSVDAKSVAFDWVNENRRALSDWNQVISRTAVSCEA